MFVFVCPGDLITFTHMSPLISLSLLTESMPSARLLLSFLSLLLRPTASLPNETYPLQIEKFVLLFLGLSKPQTQVRPYLTFTYAG